MATLKFKVPVTLTVYEYADYEEGVEEKFEDDEEIDVAILDEDKEDISVQFGDGSVAFGVRREWFDIVSF
jgi:hypothetical protein